MVLLLERGCHEMFSSYVGLYSGKDRVLSGSSPSGNPFRLGTATATRACPGKYIFKTHSPTSRVLVSPADTNPHYLRWRTYNDAPFTRNNLSSCALNISWDHRAGSCHDPSTGTHIAPPSETAKGGIILYCGGVISPSQDIVKNRRPLLRMPAT